MARLLVEEWLGEREEEGQGLVEYGLIVVLISIACIVAMTSVGTALKNVFTNVAGNL